jgi:hypothetical protein
MSGNVAKPFVSAIEKPGGKLQGLRVKAGCKPIGLSLRVFAIEFHRITQCGSHLATDT